jgi:hypothetical protein
MQLLKNILIFIGKFFIGIIIVSICLTILSLITYSLRNNFGFGIVLIMFLILSYSVGEDIWEFFREKLFTKHKSVSNNKFSQYQVLKEKIKEFSKLKENWDSHGAKPLPNDLIVSAYLMLMRMNELKILPESITNTTESIEFLFNNKKFIEVYAKEQNDAYNCLVYGVEHDDYYDAYILDFENILKNYIYEK